MTIDNHYAHIYTHSCFLLHIIMMGGLIISCVYSIEGEPGNEAIFDGYYTYSYKSGSNYKLSFGEKVLW